MKTDKRHFLFNLEWAEILSELPQEVKYEVYDAIIEYAQSGKLLELKPIAKGCFLFIKKELDYYKDSYSSKIEKRREAGSKGGRNRNKPEKNAIVTDAKQTKQTQAKQANEANANFAKQTKQTQANASINKNKNENENIKKYFVVDEITREEFLRNFFSDERVEVNNQLCMNLHISPIQLRNLAEEVLTEWEATSEPVHENINRAQEHLVNHLRVKINNNRRNNGTTPNNKLSHEQRQQDFQRHIADKLSQPYDDGPDISGNY